MASQNGLVSSLLNGLSNGTNGITHDHTRPLVLSYIPTGSRVHLPVPEKNYVAAEILRDVFTRFLDDNEDAKVALAFDEVDTSADDEEESGNDSKANQAKAQLKKDRQLVLLSLFLRLVSSPAHTSPHKNARAEANISILRAAVNHLVEAFLQPSGIDIHALAFKLDTEQRRIVIRSFFEARTVLEQNGQLNVASGPISKLLTGSQGQAVVHAVFGGQGTNEVYFDELSSLYALYAPLLTDILAKATDVLSGLAEKNKATLLYQHSLLPLPWLLSPDSRPPTAYLASCSASLPLIGLTQICQYIVTARVLGLSPDEMRSKLSGATGHSQGVITAAIISRKVEGNTWAGFAQNACEGLTLLFYIGMRGTEAFPPRSVAPALVKDCVDQGEGIPTPMLAVTGLAKASLQKTIDQTNGHLSSQGKGTVHISLHNGLKAVVVTGPPASLVGLVSHLRKGKAESGKDQSKIPYSKRLPSFSIRFLPIPVPYHSIYLEGCTKKVIENDMPDASFWDRKQLEVPVFNTEDGTDLRDENASSSNLLTDLCDQIFTSPIHWAVATNYPADTTHVIDFGPGGNSGIGSLTAREREGTGVRVVFASGGTAGRGNEEVYDAQKVRYESRWEEKFAPKLVKTGDGRIHLDTPFSRLLSKPPLMVAGMTPCTVQTGFNAAFLNAGYHGELAGGGHYNEKALRARVAAISAELNTPGIGLTLNALYINQRQFTFQFPLWCQMKREGLPIEGLCVAAGIPSADKAAEIITALRESGIKHVSFKPGSVEGIRQVVNIAASNPDFPVIMQWTGGRAGGHHSCEDFHQPMLATYGSIRQFPNLILVGGSGFGNVEDVYPYLTGEWSKQYGVQAMPYDGFLFASRVMVAKEAHTSTSVKQLIVDAPGVGDDKWEQTYDKPTGGILTVTSELGEPIHKVATRGVKLWREFDDTVFALPRDKQAAWLQQKKDYVIKRLNADFQKTWFGAKDDGTVCDVADMTYGETLRRMVRLMYVKHQSRWVDRSLRDLVGDWVRRIEERISQVQPGSKVNSELQSFVELEDPFSFMDRFFKKYPAANTQLLAATDARYFLAICQRPGQKPVPFIPVLDSTFSVWFKKDSLWQAEDIDAVLDQDPQRVCVLQGPVAVKHSTIVDEPVKDILGNIENGLISKVLESKYGGDESKIPTESYLARKPTVSEAAVVNTYDIKHSTTQGSDGSTVHVYDISSELPPHGEWLDTLAGPKSNWLRAFLTSISIVQGSKVVENQAARVFAPRPKQRVKIVFGSDGNPSKVEVFGATRS